VQLELGLHPIQCLFIRGLVCQSHGIHQTVLVAILTERGRSCRQHVVVIWGIVTISILLVNRHVRHFAVSNIQQITIVLLVILIRQVKVRHNLDAVAHKIIQGHTSRETVKLLGNDRTGLVVVTGRDTERSLLSSTGKRHIMLLQPTHLGHRIHPVRIVVVMFILCKRRIVIKLRNVGRSIT